LLTNIVNGNTSLIKVQKSLFGNYFISVPLIHSI
jgi:hypothetical protein